MYECAQSAITANNLNLPVYDIHQKQARDQILFNFHTLANTTSSISERHMQKCTQQNDRIQILRDRINKCKDRIQNLSGLNQAIVFVSPSQYPSKYQFNSEEKKSRFADYLRRTEIHKLDMNAQYIVKHEGAALGKDAKLAIKDLDEFVLYLFGKLKGKRKTIFEKGISNKKHIENLGRIPASIRSVDSLTVFNTHINPYRKYQVSKNAIDIENYKKPQTKSIPTDLPVINDANLSNFQKGDNIANEMKYIKKSQDYEQIQFDDSLNVFGLDNIVNLETAFNDDTSFKNTKKKNVVKDNYTGDKKVQVSNVSSADTSRQSSSIIAAPPPQIGNLAPPPPLNMPPPPPQLNLPPPPPLNILPPPPPPPPLLLPPPAIGLPPALPSLRGPLPMALPMPSSGGGGQRSALLKEIQNPNPMARLKKTVTKQYSGVKSAGGDGPSQSSAPAAVDPNDMMAALKARIQKRFKVLHPDEADD